MPLRTKRRALLTLVICANLFAYSSQAVFAGSTSKGEQEIEKLQQQLQDMLERDTLSGQDPVSRLLQELLHSTKELICESWNTAIRLRLDDLQTSVTDPRLAQTLKQLRQAIEQACAPLTYQALNSLPGFQNGVGENQSQALAPLVQPEIVPGTYWTLFDEVCVRKGYSQKQTVGQMSALPLSAPPEKTAVSAAPLLAEDTANRDFSAQRQALIRDHLQKKLGQAGYDTSMSLSDFNLIQRIYWRALSPEGLSEQDVAWLRELLQKDNRFFEQLSQRGYIAEFKLRPVQSGGFVSQTGFIPVLDPVAAEELKRAYEARLPMTGSSGVTNTGPSLDSAAGEKSMVSDAHAVHSNALREEAITQAQPLTAPSMALAALPPQDGTNASYDYPLPWAQDSGEMAWVNEIYSAQELSEFTKNAGEALRLGVPKEEIDAILTTQQEVWVKTPQPEHRLPAAFIKEDAKFLLGAKVFDKLHPQAIVIENPDETEIIVAAVTKARLEEEGKPQKWTQQEITKLQELSRNNPISDVWYKVVPGTKGFQPGFYQLVEAADISAIQKAAQRSDLQADTP